MSYHEEALEFQIYGAIAVTNSCFKVLDQFLEHLFQDLKLNIAVRGEHILSNGLVGGKHAIKGGRVVAAQNTSSFLELTLTDVLSGKLSKELVKNLLVLLFSDRETLIPTTFLCENFET